MRHKRAAVILAVLLAVAPVFAAGREIKPGWNAFSREQDVQLGREAAQQVEQQVPLVRNAPELQNYIARLGSELARHSGAADFPYSFNLVADKNINAFALPGGPVYLNTGTIAAAFNEAQVAGVLAHEIAHVALRHSTHQATKAYAWQIPLALAGAALGGGGSMLGQLAQLGMSFGVNSVLLKYSRDAERDADIVGARMMAAAGYDPVEMARFFETLQGQRGGGSTMQFFSDHPNPGNRIQTVQEEVAAMPARQYRQTSPEFARMRQLAGGVAVPTQRRGYVHPPSEGHAHPEYPSGEFREYRGNGFRLSYPGNWQAYGAENGAGVTIAPQQGLVRDRSGAVQIAMGAIAGYFEPDSDNLTTATNQLIQDLRARNPDLRPLRGQRQGVSVDGSNGEVVLLMGSSPLGNQREVSSLLTASRPQGLFYLILVSPEQDYNSVRPIFDAVQRSVRFR